MKRTRCAFKVIVKGGQFVHTWSTNNGIGDLRSHRVNATPFLVCAQLDLAKCDENVNTSRRGLG